MTLNRIYQVLFSMKLTQSNYQIIDKFVAFLEFHGTSFMQNTENAMKCYLQHEILTKMGDYCHLYVDTDQVSSLSDQ